MNGATYRIRISRAQRGQAAVLAALSLFTMVVFLAMATNMGILVNDRIRMQNTADLTAYAGAFEQARTMNEMADLNSQLYAQVQRLRGVLNYGPAYDENDTPDNAPIFYWKQPPCSCYDYSPAAEAYIKAYQKRLDAIADAIDKVNLAGQTTSKAAATLTASRNFLGENASERHLDFFEELPSSPTGSPVVVQLDRVDDTNVGYNYLRSCPCCDGCCIYPQIKVEQINSWPYKAQETNVFFPAMVKGVPLKNFLSLHRGSDEEDTTGSGDILYGYASAKPFEGIVGTSNPDNANIGGSLTPQNPVYPPSDQLVDYFRATYRARVAGIHENMGTDSAPSSMADLIRQDSSEPLWQDKTSYFTH